MNLIDKDALVAEIEKIYYEDYKFLPSDIVEHVQNFKDDVLINIDTLEVKEVDLDEAARKWEDKVYLEKGWQDEYGTPHAPFSEIGNAFREGAKFMIKAQKGE